MISSASNHLPEQPSNPQSQGFDYSILDSETRIVVQQRTHEIRERLQYTAQAAWEIGQKLVDVRNRLEYGLFDSWLEAEFECSRRTAYNYISVFESFDSSATVAQVKVAARTLYLLAAPSTPQEAREEALERAVKGEAISHSSARAIVDKYKPASRETFSATNIEPPNETVSEEPTPDALPLDEPAIAVETKPVDNNSSSSFLAEAEQKEEPVLPTCDDEREQVCINTQRAELRQWNDRIGFVVARDSGTVHVKFGDYTLSFQESEVQPIVEQPDVGQEEAEILNLPSQQDLPVRQLQLELPQDAGELRANEDECDKAEVALESTSESRHSVSDDYSQPEESHSPETDNSSITVNGVATQPTQVVLALDDSTKNEHLRPITSGSLVPTEDQWDCANQEETGDRQSGVVPKDAEPPTPAALTNLVPIFRRHYGTAL